MDDRQPLLPSSSPTLRDRWPVAAFLLIVILVVWGSVKETMLDDALGPNILVWTSTSPDAPLLSLEAAPVSVPSAAPLVVYLSSGASKPCATPSTLHAALWLHLPEASAVAEAHVFLQQWLVAHPQRTHAPLWLASDDATLAAALGHAIVDRNFAATPLFVHLEGLILMEAALRPWACTDASLPSSVTTLPASLGPLLDAQLRVVFAHARGSNRLADSIPWHGQKALHARNASSERCLAPACAATLLAYDNLASVELRDTVAFPPSSVVAAVVAGALAID
ncbi:hypothetical protein SPRG_12217 [Saprolegnia parasitica CBS 223.65]|uniref:Uncharacterized protein n=1 Tax=Saprolegnia parasitica (strain CBS 223.65) TaxID=695850 RepID=A0A067BUQ2_SAPPC|nr:hypothetical protein SPRG_12217 [Saprolegnia parasitica CBS 223.65]KDO22008.1 hypothetical protein SPRG_12217 [Saprolegnia parasitica CBS 223.65]|eukprot:XP_012207252.1 hypothetical protein SPRG_12217 [Saprolegnia parasitica CBS 223.65]